MRFSLIRFIGDSVLSTMYDGSQMAMFQFCNFLLNLLVFLSEGSSFPAATFILVFVCLYVLFFIYISVFWGSVFRSLNCILFLSLVALSYWSLHPSYIPPLSFEHYSVFSHHKMFQVILYLYCPDLEAIVSSRSTGSFL